MIHITDKSQCCGCEACVQVCPKQCISFKQDHEGFSYPEVDVSICIRCGLCEKVCPVLNPYDESKPIEVLAAINKDEEVRMASSSGGVFTLLAENVIKQGGVVFGVRFDDQWQAVFDYAETVETLSAFRGSKYLQARVDNSFAQCKQFLDHGRRVLYSGTQCQIAGLLHFLRKPYPNLLTVDFICHGVPSPRVWSKYLEEVVTSGKRVISDISFRDKRLGWKLFNFTLVYSEQGNIYTMTSAFPENPFMRAFLANLILRPSCHACPSKSGRSHSDITIADFWGIDKVNPQMDDDHGTSLVLVNTEKGEGALQYDHLLYGKTTYDDVLRYNPSIAIPARKHPRREVFFASFFDEVNLHELIAHCMRPTLTQKFMKTVWFSLRQIKRLIVRVLKKQWGGIL